MDRRILVAMLGMLCVPGVAPAQYRVSNVPVTSMNAPAAPEPSPNFSFLESSVSFIDSALPRTTFRTYADLDYRNRRPTRADYKYSKEGQPRPETRVDAQTWNSYVEVAAGWVSFFANQRVRWVNPEANDNEFGAGNLDFGFKFAFLDLEGFLVTAQVRATAPTAANDAIESRHWALEPALLANAQIFDFLTLEGEARYWIPMTEHAYAGDVVRYGLGLVLGNRSDEFWFTPVAEVVGWTVLGGLTEVVEPLAIDVQGAANNTIVNGNLGGRFGMGQHAEIYAGYSRPLTGHSWYKDLFRVEFRLVY